MAKRRIKCAIGEKRFTVIRVNGDSSDTHAGRSFESALRLANPDRGNKIEVFATCAGDGGAARLMIGRKQLLRSFRYKGR